MDPTKRFSNRVEHYIKHRPGYPSEVIDLLQNDLDLTSSSVIADIGSGTGISTELFLRNGNVVYAVEPNPEMREAAEGRLQSYPTFHSINGSAEDTTLDSKSVDFIVAGQSFHWFDRKQCRAEFSRILQPGGWLVLIWNERRVKSAFEIDYEELLKEYATDYLKVDHRNITGEILSEFFATNPYTEKVFDYYQELDFDGLKGRLLSSSYVPTEGAAHDPMMQELQVIFRKHSRDGRILLGYDTRVFYGKLD